MEESMNILYLDELWKNLEILISNGVLKDKYIVVFGVNKPAEQTILYLRSHEFSVNIILDNNTFNQGKVFMDIPIVSPENALFPFRSNAVILIASKYYKEMGKQLQELDYQENVHFFQTIQYRSLSDSQDEFDHMSFSVKKGKKIYTALKEEYGKDCFLCICPYNGIGDAYFIASFLRQFLEKENIINYVFTVVSNSCYRVVKMFGYENVHLLRQQESDELCYFSRFVGTDNLGVKIFTHTMFHQDILVAMEQTERMDWGTMFLKILMGFKNDVQRQFPLFSEHHLEIQKLFQECGLKPGRTAVLSPYANTVLNSVVSEQNNDLWENLVCFLKENGYTVCTNCASPTELPLKGTVPLVFPLEQVVETIEYAGLFIGVRSGLCDLVSSANATIIILYLNRKDLFFNLKSMGLSRNVVEILYENFDLLKSKLSAVLSP